MCIEDALDKFIHMKKLCGLSKKTIQDYKDFIRLFIDYLGCNIDIYDLTQEDIENYIEYQVDRDISRNTLATYLRHFKIFIKWLCENYNVSIDSKKIRVPKTSKKNLKIYSEKEIITIFENCENSIEWITDRNKLIISLMLDSGIRQGEVVSLKNVDMLLSEKRMCVCGKGNKERFVPLGNTSIKLYNKYISTCPYENEYVFLSKDGKPINANAIKLFINKLAKRVGFELSSHKLRHNFATNYCIDMYKQNGNMDIYRLKTIMGHEDLETTQKYMHIANEIIACSENLSHLDRIKIS